MSTATARRTPPATAAKNDAASAETAATTPWLSVVAEKVENMKYGVVQIVVHDSKVVQIERTERTRFEVPSVSQSR